jgi:adenine-specific DNA-methyltransferase
LIGEKVEYGSSDKLKEKIEKLKELFPNIVKDGEIDFEALKMVLGEEVSNDRENWKFEWVGKENCYRVANSQSSGTLKYIREESLNPEKGENIIIEGDNLEVLKLLQSSYKESVKMIYIDPPYNTGNDFVYPDNYETPLENYFELTGQTENGEATQSKKTKEGRKHTQWLNMMLPRLLLSRTLLKDDGVIFISIDDNEVHNLRMVCDEVFGEENFLSLLTWKGMHTVRNSSKHFNKNSEYILVYAKDYNKLIVENNQNTWLRIPKDKSKNYPFDDKDGKGKYKLDPLHARNYAKPYKFSFQNDVEWEAPKGRYPLYSVTTLTEMEKENEIVFTGQEPKAKRYLNRVLEGIAPDTCLKPEDVLYSKDGTQELSGIFPEDKLFDQPKPTKLIKYFLSISNKENREKQNNDLILDFFAGSGTTAHSVLNLNKEDNGNRKFILVQLPEPTKNPEFPTIAEITKERVRRVIKGYGDNPPIDSGFKVFKLDNSNYKEAEKIVVSLESDRDELLKSLRNSLLADSPLVDGYSEIDVIYENILKEGYNLHSKIEKLEIESTTLYRVTDSVKSDKKFYITFQKVSDDILQKIEVTKETIFIALDNNLTDSDKANLSNMVRLKTI